MRGIEYFVFCYQIFKKIDRIKATAARNRGLAQLAEQSHALIN